MSQPDPFALKNSKLNAFLFAEIGIEQNGSELTMLSALARLGKDPWIEAARWAQEPKADAIKSLTASIIDMPLSPQAIQDARSTASRLVLLLPAQSQRPGGGHASPHVPGAVPALFWIMLGCFWVYLAFSAGTAVSAKPDAAEPAAIIQSFNNPQ